MVTSLVLTIFHALNVRPEPILLTENVFNVSLPAAHAQDLTNVLLALRDLGFKEKLAKHA